VSNHSEEIAARIVCVTFAESPMLALFERELGLPVEYLGDPEREMYRAFGFGRGSVARVWLDPRVLARYARLVVSGYRPKGPEQDTLQLGGDVLADAEGRIAWIYRSRGPEDRPSVAEILAARRGMEGRRGPL